jgi:hypothetical protein
VHPGPPLDPAAGIRWTVAEPVRAPMCRQQAGASSRHEDLCARALRHELYPETARRRRNALQACSVPARIARRPATGAGSRSDLPSPDPRSVGGSDPRRPPRSSAGPMVERRRPPDACTSGPAGATETLSPCSCRRAPGTEKLLAQGEQDVIPGAEGISTRHGRQECGLDDRWVVPIHGGGPVGSLWGSQKFWSAGELAATWPAICREYHAPEARE